jgi:hypothetical protein
VIDPDEMAVVEDGLACAAVAVPVAVAAHRATGSTSAVVSFKGARPPDLRDCIAFPTPLLRFVRPSPLGRSVERSAVRDARG